MPKSCLACLLLFWTVTSYADKVVSIVTEEAYPMNYELDGKVAGVATDYLKRIMELSGYEYNLTIMPWNRAYKTASEQKNTLLYSVARTAEREADFHWLFQIRKIQYYLFGLAQRKDEFSNEDICERRKIAVVRDDVTHNYLKKLNCGELVLAQSYKQLHSLLTRERVDFIASSALGMKYFIRRHADESQSFYSHRKLDGMSTALYYAMNINSDSDVVESLSRLFDEQTDHSSYDGIEQM